MTTWPGRSLAFAILLVPLVWLLGAIAIYAVRAHVLGNAPVDQDLARRGSSALLGSTVRQAFAWCMTPVERWFLASGVSPDFITLTGFVVCACGAVLVGMGDLTVGGLAVLESAGFDYMDGRIARRRAIVSPAGEFLDSTLDRYSDAFCFAGAAFLFRHEAWHLVAALVAFGASGVVPYARAKAAALSVDLRSGLMQRPERVVLLSAAAIFSAPLDSLWPASMQAGHPTFATMVWFLAGATAWTAVARTREGLRQLRVG